MRVNGQERVPQSFRKGCCYITQEFAMLGLLTVQETFKTTADLKLGNSVSDQQKLSVVSVDRTVIYAASRLIKALNCFLINMLRCA